MLAFRECRWEECFAFAMRALRIKDRLKVYTCDPDVWGSQPHDLASISAWHLKLPDICIEQAKIAVQLEPENKRLQANLVFVTAPAESGKVAAE